MSVRLVTIIAAALLIAACSDSSKNATPSSGARSPSAATSAPIAPSRAAGSATVAAANPPGRASAPPRNAQIPPFDPNTFTLGLEPVASGLREPDYVTSANDGSGRLFVVERRGTIHIIQNGAVVPDPFLDVSNLISSVGEQGLLGLAFHPDYRNNGRFFISYTANNTQYGDNTIAEYHVSAGNPNRADAGSAKILLAIPDFASNHNGGMLAFGPDGYLYSGHGDGGGSGDPRRNGQNINVLLGKILRLDVDHGDPYTIPADNPFAGRSDARGEIWAYGLRNPWRFSFDRVTGDLWIGDVGEQKWEEIDIQPAASHGGENYGWSVVEGNHCFNPRSDCSTVSLTPPIMEYSHVGGNCSVTGGYVYRGQAQPLLYGGYFCADYCSGRIWSLYQDAPGSWRATEMLHTDISISSFGEDEAGEVYLTGINNGTVYRLTATPR
jgi:glucose/arabinose dehydrogenase